MLRTSRRRVLLGIALLAALLAGGGGWYYDTSVRAAAATPVPTTKTTAVRKGDLTLTASGTGSLVAAVQANLGFKFAGRLAELAVQVGSQVKAGDVLARLDDSDARVTVSQADIAVKLAQLKLTQLTKGADAAALAAAQAGLAGAQADLVRLTTPATAADLAAARDNLTAAQKALATLQSGPRPEDVTIAASDLQKAAVAVQKAQADYDKVAAQADIGMLPQAAALQQATLDYEKAKANYALKTAGPTEDQLAAARAKVAQAQSQLDNLQKGSDPAAIAAARSKVAQMQAQLDALTAGATPEDIESAQLQVQQAQNSLQSAQAQLDNALLRAPFAGTVAAVRAAAGEWVSTAPILTLVDSAHVQAQFYVDESDMGGLAVGNPVQVTLDALPDRTFVGRVLRVDPTVEKVEGVPVASMLAELDPAQAGSDQGKLLPGMSASAEVVMGERKGVLLVPIAALRELGPGQYAVMVASPGGALAMRPVQVGLKDFVNAEIVSGLQAGELVSTGSVDTSE
jgi:HlyD family secretion protein